MDKRKQILDLHFNDGKDGYEIAKITGTPAWEVNNIINNKLLINQIYRNE